MKPLNLLLIQTDQLSANALGYAGCPHVKTPHLDRLAERSISFGKAVCAFPKCVPSRTALLYGRMPHELMLPGTELDYDAKPGDPARGVRSVFKAQELGHWFSKAGYDCVYAGKWHVGQWGPTESLRPEYGSGFRALGPINDPLVPQVCADYFRQRDPHKPFLMVASFDNPHNICEYAWHDPLPWGNLPPAPGPSELPPYPGNGYRHPAEPAAIRQLQTAVADRQGWQADDWRRYRWAYYRLVEKVDAEIGRLLAGLDAAGLTDSTAIVFTSDHGDMQGAHLLTQKDTLYEESLRVPYLLSMPGESGGIVRDFLVNNALDTFPTLCALAGIEPPEGLRGVSLASSLPDRPYVASELKFRFGGGEARAVCSQRFKYIAYDCGPNSEQLFDLQTDPGEMTQLAETPAFAEILAQHRAFLREELLQTQDAFGRKLYTHPGRVAQLPGDEWADSIALPDFLQP